MEECNRTAPGINLNGMHILLVDDEVINLELISEVLTGRGVVVSCALNGIEAVAQFKQQKFDLILMDMLMPVKDGAEAVSDIRKIEQSYDHSSTAGDRTAIIAMSGLPEDEYRQKCLELGFNGYIAKPVIWKMMFNEIAIVLSESKTQRTDLQEKTVESKGVDYEKFLDEMCNGNERLAIRLVNMFVMSRGPELLKSAVEAVDRRDVKLLREICHSMIGVTGSICAVDMANLAKKLRELAIADDWSAIPAVLGKLWQEHDRNLNWWENFSRNK